MRTRLAVVWYLSCLSAGPAAVQLSMDPRAVSEAISIGRSGIERDRARFHAVYRVLVAGPPLDYIEVVTPFRRIMLAAETRARIGDPRFGQRQGIEIDAAASAQIDLWLEFTFHPLNTYVGVPAYEVTLVGPGGARVKPRAVERVPRYGARVDHLPQPFPVPGGAVSGGGQPMLGGTVIAQLDGRVLNPTGLYEVVVAEAGKELARARLDLARIR